MARVTKEFRMKAIQRILDTLSRKIVFILVIRMIDNITKKLARLMFKIAELRM